MEMDSILQKHRRRTAATAPGAEWTKQKRDTVSSSSSSSASTATVPISDDYVLLEEEWPRIEIHVVFHYSYLVVRNSLSSSFFSSANKSISAQLKSLNLDFKDTGFSFTLSTPINFINLNATIPKDQDRRERVAIDPDLPFKQLHRIGGAETLNVYLHTLNASLFGYANYASEYQFHPGDDGIVLNKRTMPKSKDSYWLYGDGKTLTHETGHWLQLRHTFEGNCTCKGEGGRGNWRWNDLRS